MDSLPCLLIYRTSVRRFEPPPSRCSAYAFATIPHFSSKFRISTIRFRHSPRGSKLSRSPHPAVDRPRIALISCAMVWRRSSATFRSPSGARPCSQSRVTISICAHGPCLSRCFLVCILLLRRKIDCCVLSTQPLNHPRRTQDLFATLPRRWFSLFDRVVLQYCFPVWQIIRTVRPCLPRLCIECSELWPERSLVCSCVSANMCVEFQMPDSCDARCSFWHMSLKM